MKPNEFIKPIVEYFKPKYYMTEVMVGGGRVDLLMFIDHWGKTIIGVEIKSDKDTFKRLERQLGDYYNVCDRVYVAVQSKEPPKELPYFIGVLKVSEEGAVEIQTGRPLYKNEQEVECLWKRAKKEGNGF